MDLTSLRSHWDRWGSTDPLWSILSAPERRFGAWDEAEFFQTGILETDSIFSELNRLQLAIAPERALDFGCGVGRLTAALAHHFKHVDGVDIAPSMVAEARRRFGDDSQMAFHLVEDDSLSMFPTGTFDFIYTAHVLQHMEPRYSERYVREFVRVLAPGGVAVIQMTTEPRVLEHGETADSCLEEGGHRARLGIARVGELTAGHRAMATVVVVNESDATWRAAGTRGWFMVSLANRWRDRSGLLLVADDGRATLPRDLAPGDALVTELEIRVPERAGSYVLEVDLVQEGCSWFADRGSLSAQLPIEIAGRRRLHRTAAMIGSRVPRSIARKLPLAVKTRLRSALSAPIVEEQPIMEMYGVRESTMTSWIEAEGAKLVEVFDWGKIGDPGTDWVRRVFVIQKT